MNCNCFKELNEKAEARVLEVIGKDSIFEEGEKGIDGRVYYFGSGHCNFPVNLNYSFSFYKKKKDGTPAKSKTKQELSVPMAFCPMCGIENYIEKD